MGYLPRGLAAAVAQTRVSELMASMNELEDQLRDQEQLEAAALEMRQHVAALRLQLNDAERDSARARQELTVVSRTSRQELQTLTTRATSLADALRQGKEGPQVGCQTDETWSDIQQRLTEHRGTVAALTDRLRRLTDEKEQMHARHHSAHAEVVHAREEQTRMQAECDSLRHLVSRLKAEKEEEIRHAQDARKESAKLKNDLKAAENEKLKLEYMCERAREREMTVAGNQRDLSTRLANLSRREGDLNARIGASHTLQEDLVRSIQLSKNAASGVGRREAELRTLIDETEELKHSIANRERRLKQREEAMVDTEESHKRALEEIDREAQASKEALAKAQQQRDTVRQEILALKDAQERLNVQSSDATELK
ncbi:hypothetical protein KIPB_000543, partial [Kipferlia bialata]|eukprot:g543.t1